MMRRPILAVLIGYLLASAVLVTAQGTGWRIRQGTTEIFVGTVARPQTDGADFGTTATRWDLFAGTINTDDVLTSTSYFAAPVGTDCTAATIGYSFTGDTNTGLTAVAADQIDWCLGGALEARLTATALTPGASDGNALGTASLMWADLFLASGSVINFNNGDVTLTHGSNVVTVAGEDIAVPDDAYAAGWNGSVNVPTKNAVYDKIEALAPVAGVAAGYKLARAETALDGSNPTSVASGLATIVSCTLTLKGTAAPGIGTSVLTGNINGTNFDVYAWKVTSAIDDTLIASTGTESFYTVCVGT